MAASAVSGWTDSTRPRSSAPGRSGAKRSRKSAGTSGVVAASASFRARRAPASCGRESGAHTPSMSSQPDAFLTSARESIGMFLFAENKSGRIQARGRPRCSHHAPDARSAPARPAPAPPSRGGHPHHRRGHRRGPVVRRSVRRADGRQRRERRADGARGLPPAGGPRPGPRPGPAALAGARGRLRAGPRRGPERAQRRRAAVGVPRGRPGRLARAGRDRGGRRGPGRHAGRLRRAGVRLHRRAVGSLGRRSRRRARDQRAGAPGLPRPAGVRHPARRPGRRAGGRGRAGRLAAAQDPDRGDPAQRAGAAGRGASRPAHARRRSASRPACPTAWACCWCPTSAAGPAHG